MSLASSLAGLWRAGDLTDVVLVSGQGPRVQAHKCVLAACSGYMRALFLGAGTCMRACTAPWGDSGGQQMQVVELPDADAQDVQTILEGMYSDGQVKVHSGNLEALLRLASFLDAPSIIAACVQFCQQELCDSTVVPLMVLAARYSLQQLKAQLLTYICSRFSRLLQHPKGLQEMEVDSCHYQAAAIDEALLGSSWPPRSSNRAASCIPPPAEHSRSVACSYGSSPGSSWAPSAGHRYMLQLQEGRQQGAAEPQRTQEHTSRPGLRRSTDVVVTGQAAWEQRPKCRAQGPSSASSMDGSTVEAKNRDGLAQPTAGPSSLNQLPKDLLLEILNSEELVVDCELDVLQCVVDWIAHDASARMDDLPQLMNAVHVDNLPLPLPHSLAALSEQHAMVCAAVQQLLISHADLTQEISLADPTQEILHAGRPTQDQQVFGPVQLGSLQVQQPVMQMPMQLVVQEPTQQQDSRRSGAATSQHTMGALHCSIRSAQALANNGKQSSVQGHGRRSRRSIPTMLLAAGGRDATWHSPKTVEIYEPSVGAWVAGPTMPQGVSFAAAALLGKDVYVVGGTPIRSCVTKLVGGTHWEPCANLLLPRAHTSLVCHAGTLFAIGGRSQVQSVQQVLSSMEVCDGDGWTMGPDMATSRTALAAAALQGGLYAIGGQTTKSTLRSMERFDLGAEKWYTLNAQLSTERKYGSAVVLGWRIYVVGGMDESRVKHGIVEALDPREGRWARVAPISMPRSSAGLAALQMGPHGRLFLAGGSAPGDHVHESVEVYMPEMDAWVAGCPLGHGRSGLALCAA